MKILMVNKFLYPKGGSEIYMFDLASKLEQKGHKVCYFGMRDEKNIIKSDMDVQVNNLDFNTKSITRAFYPFKTIYSAEARRKIECLIERFKPDIVHLNNFNYQLTPSIIYGIKKYSIPIVQTVHDTNIICPFHRLYNFKEQKICEKCKKNKYFKCLQTRCVDNSLAKSLVATAEAYFYHMLNTYRHITYLICPSQFMADKLTEFGIDKNKIKVLHNFTVMDRAFGTVEKKEQVLYFGRISEEKGIKTLLEAVSVLNDIKFVFAGAGPLVEELKKYPNVEYVGYKNGDELYRLVKESLFTVIPSEWYENCPMSVLESQSLGTPVVGADIGGIPELIENNINGLLFKSGNKDDLAAKVDYLYKNRSDLHFMSSRGIEDAQKFSINHYYDEIINIYREAIRLNGTNTSRVKKEAAGAKNF